MKKQTEYPVKDKKNSTAVKNDGNGKKSKADVNGDPITAATASVKPRTGHGLANEGTVVNYEEER